jgi:hypothetical protein
MLATLCVISSLDLVALGGSDPTGEFHLGTLSICRPLGNRGACFRYDYRISRCRVVVRQVGVVSTWARHFGFSVVTPWGYKAGGRPCAQTTSSCKTSYRLPNSFPMAEKKES